MHNPYLIRIKYGVWHCIFQVNNYSNQLAITESRNLVLSQPQDYPYMEMEGVGSCLNPVIKYDDTISTVRNSKTEKVYIKMVKLLNHPVKGKININNAESLFGKSASLNGNIVTPSSEYELPAYSFSLIEL